MRGGGDYIVSIVWGFFVLVWFRFGGGFFFFTPWHFARFTGGVNPGVKSMADEQEIMCKLESIKEIRYVCFVPHRVREAAFSSGERRSCIDPKVAVVLPRERELPPGLS